MSQFLKGVELNEGIDKGYFIPNLIGNGAPTEKTEGAVGSQYMNTSNGDIYVCTAAENGSYTWRKTNDFSEIPVLDTATQQTKVLVIEGGTTLQLPASALGGNGGNGVAIHINIPSEIAPEDMNTKYKIGDLCFVSDPEGFSIMAITGFDTESEPGLIFPMLEEKLRVDFGAGVEPNIKVIVAGDYATTFDETLAFMNNEGMIEGDYNGQIMTFEGYTKEESGAAIWLSSQQGGIWKKLNGNGATIHICDFIPDDVWGEFDYDYFVSTYGYNVGDLLYSTNDGSLWVMTAINYDGDEFCYPESGKIYPVEVSSTGAALAGYEREEFDNEYPTAEMRVYFLGENSGGLIPAGQTSICTYEDGIYFSTGSFAEGAFPHEQDSGWTRINPTAKVFSSEEELKNALRHKHGDYIGQIAVYVDIEVVDASADYITTESGAYMYLGQDGYCDAIWKKLSLTEMK